MEYNIFKLLVDNIPQPIWIKDLDLKFIYVNEEYENIYKGRNKKFIGLKDEEIFDGAINDECYRYCNLVINSLEATNRRRLSRWKT